MRERGDSERGQRDRPQARSDSSPVARSEFVAWIPSGGEADGENAADIRPNSTGSWRPEQLSTEICDEGGQKRTACEG